jgi:hypothetical protein
MRTESTFQRSKSTLINKTKTPRKRKIPRPKNGPTSVDPKLKTITAMADNSTPTQNTGTPGKTPTK